ncbi:MAG: hypothetical protein AAGA58_05725 [Verrucomicrobiota bacterium]
MMKMNPNFLSASIGLFALMSSATFAQGPLTPPASGDSVIGPDAALSTGTPVPFMKTLHEVEPRMPISQPASAAAITINTSGSYYLTENLFFLENGISIAADDVTLDLNGFAVTHENLVDGGSAIILQSGVSNITIRNGSIAEGGLLGTVFNNGISSSSNVTNVRVTDLHVRNCANQGIELPKTGGTIVKRCQVRSTTGTGIEAEIVSQCTVNEADSSAIDTRIANGCEVLGPGGILAEVASHCRSTVDGTNAAGLAADLVDDCEGDSQSGKGIAGLLVYNSRGECASGDIGIDAEIVYRSFGQAVNSTGIRADHGVAHSMASSSGLTGTGIRGQNVTNCRTFSNNLAAGILADQTISFSHGNGGSITGVTVIGCSQQLGAPITGTNRFFNKPLP